MNRQEAIQLLALIKVAYPTAYRDMDQATKVATVNMWQMSFPEVPYQIMEQAFNHHRMVSKFPPTVAEMVEELKGVYYEALECASVHKTLGNEDEVRRYRTIMDCTSRYKNNANLGLQLGGIRVAEIGGGQYAGTSGNRLDRENRVPFLDAGGR